MNKILIPQTPTYGYASGVVDTGQELEIGDTISNSSWLYSLTRKYTIESYESIAFPPTMI